MNIKMGDEIDLIERAINKCGMLGDKWNGERYQNIKDRYLKTDIITMVEYMDVRLYLGLSVD